MVSFGEQHVAESRVELRGRERRLRTQRTRVQERVHKRHVHCSKGECTATAEQALPATREARRGEDNVIVSSDGGASVADRREQVAATRGVRGVRNSLCGRLGGGDVRIGVGGVGGVGGVRHVICE